MNYAGYKIRFKSGSEGGREELDEGGKGGEGGG